MRALKLSVLSISLFASLAQASDPKATVDTVKLVKSVFTQAWTPCNSRLIPCSTVYTILGFDDAGKLRLILTRLSLIEGREERSLPGVTTAVYVENGQTISNYGNQYPKDPGTLSDHMFMLAPDCPVTLKINKEGQVLKSSCPCNHGSET